jgi:hypothetical protein
MNKASEADERVSMLMSGFPRFLAAFEKRPPFTRPGQYEFHREAIDLRRSAGSATDALHDRRFLTALYKTLQAWGWSFPAFVDR